MSVSIKSAHEIELMRESCRRLSIVHKELEEAIRPGISTLDIDRLGEKLIRSLGGIPNFLHYNGYPASICVSVNDEVVHGIPSKHRILQEGDIVSLDAGLIYKGFHSDAARTHAVGKVSPEAQKLMDVSYYPTRFEIQFAYGNSEMNRSQAADFLNTMLSNYKTYFMRTYGYNDALGDALTAVDYTTYDYPQALDVFSSTLNSLQNYVSTLSQNDNTRFRSSDTGYTFADLNESINTLRSVDYATLSSYVLGKNVTKDKASLAIYYQYRIDNLNRNLSSANEKLATITDSIKNYQKDSMVVMAGADATSSSALTQPSEAYDDLISQKTDAQSSVSSYQQQITDYQSRLDKLNSSAVASKKDQEKVETDMKTVCDKLNKLIDDVNATADDYFETASYANSYSVLVPASGSVSNAVSNAVSNMMRPLLIAEALLFVCYLVFAIVRAFIVSYRRNAIATAAVEAEERKEAAEAAEKTEETEE